MTLRLRHSSMFVSHRNGMRELVVNGKVRHPCCKEANELAALSPLNTQQGLLNSSRSKIILRHIGDKDFHCFLGALVSSHLSFFTHDTS
jgi:hypothetical protein